MLSIGINKRKKKNTLIY